MTETDTETQAPPAGAKSLEGDVRVDEFARGVFAVHGYHGRLPDGLVHVYNDFARTKNVMQPGRLTPEGFAFVITLHRLFEKK